MFGNDPLRIHAARVGRQICGQRHAGGGHAVVGRGQSRRIRAQVVVAPFVDIHDLDGDCAFRASSYAGRRDVIRDSVVTKVAFADYAALGVVLRYAIRAVPGAVLAANTGVRVMYDDTGHGIFSIRFHRTADQAGRLQAMVAAHRQVMALHVGIVAALKLAHAPPVNRGRISILLVARHDAAFAADALRHVEVEAVLLAGTERALWH